MIQQVIQEFDWRRDWMLWLIGMMFVLVLFFEWRLRFRTLQENFLGNAPSFSITEEVPRDIHQPMYLPWRDWKRPSSIPTLVPSVSNPGGVNFDGDSQLRGGRWGWAPPMPAVEAATPVEATANQAKASLVNANAGPQLVGMVSQLGTSIDNCKQDMFEETAIPRNVYSWQSGRTRVSLTNY